MVRTVSNDVETTGQGDIRDISSFVRQAVSESSFLVGITTVAVVGSTAGITTIEYEAGAIADFNRLLEQLAPRDGAYQHHERWGDDNGSSHVRAALIGPSLTVPFTHSTLQLGTWQQIVLVECDTRPRRRQVIVQIIGE